ncbi:MAG TPA: hypothetical protein VHL77_05295 [Ferruginibacter sp.]|jgi:hypothetical protein|nr:hypothetical protein [Ferruginibacter sp.]
MNKYVFHALVIVSMIILLASCNTPRHVYSPSALNVPVLTKKGDSKIGAAYSTNALGDETIDNVKIDNRSRGFDLQGAVAITDNFAIQANHFYRWEKTEGGPDTLTIRYKRNITELGVGYYMPLPGKGNAFFQVFAGGGLGRFSFTDADRFDTNFHQANITKIYLQPAILFRSKGSFTTAIALRFSGINYSKIKTNYSASELSDYHLDDLGGRAKWFFEPATVSSFGFKNVPGLRFEVQGGLSFLMARNYFDYRKFNFSIGTWIDIGAMFRKGGQ